MNHLDNCLTYTGEKCELMFSTTKNLPQYKYFTKPIYKFCLDKIGTVAATGITFLSADLVLHQLVPQTINCLTSQVIPNDWHESLWLEDSCEFSYSYYKTLYWAAFAIPIMYVKYKRN